MEKQNEQSLVDEENAAINAEEQSDTVSFEDLGLDEYTLQAVKNKGFITPSPIQVLAIPRLLNGDTNLIAKARTGTGKTAAFGLPIIQSIKEKTNSVQALVLEPTRELAIQTCTELQSFSTKNFPRTCVLYGGASYATQIKDLKRGTDIVVGTPGRIKDHIERKTLDLSQIKYFILDEGDEMLDMGFIDDIREIFQNANQNARILLFSATMPEPILKIAADFMGEYDIIQEQNVIDEPLLIDQKYWFVRESDKIEALVRLIDISPDFYGLVFTQTKMDADNVTRQLDMRGYETAALHGDIMQNQREKVLERFRNKKTRILVATDVAARGIDISGLSHVVNYSLPFDAATYVHRIGRTGRAGATGSAITFVRPEERRKLIFLQKAIAKASKGEMAEEKIPSVEQVLSIKQERLFTNLKEKIFSSNSPEESLTPNKVSPKFIELAQTLTSEQDQNLVLANVLSILYGEQLSPDHYGKISQLKDFTPKTDQMRVFVSLGKKDGYRAKEIAEFFSKILHIPGRLVDQIDVAQQFSLVSLPVASAKKAIELSKADKKLPHMHFDVKEDNFGNSRRNRKSSFAGSNKKEGAFNDGRRSRSNSKERRSSQTSKQKTSRPNVHKQTKRNSAAAFVKKY